MAGIYNSFKSEDGKKENFVILTEDASEYMEDIHDRQPVMLLKEELKDWLKDDKFVDFAMYRGNIKLQRKIIR